LKAGRALIAASMSVSMVAYGLVLGMVPVVAIWSSAPQWADTLMFLNDTGGHADRQLDCGQAS